jgi:hypothetical protein
MKNFFKDKEGNIVVAQRPNLPLLVWAVASVLSFVPSSELIREIFSLIAFGSLFTWAWLELFHGACPFRRFLGAIVLIVVVWSAL